MQFKFGNPEIEYRGVFRNEDDLLNLSWMSTDDFIMETVDDEPRKVNYRQSPVYFWKDLISSVKNCGLVVDLFAGTGSVTEAALRVGT